MDVRALVPRFISAATFDTDQSRTVSLRSAKIILAIPCAVPRDVTVTRDRWSLSRDRGQAKTFGDTGPS